MMTKILYLLTILAFTYSQYTELKDVNSIFINLYAYLYINIIFTMALVASNNEHKKVKNILERALDYMFFGQILLFLAWFLVTYPTLIFPCAITFGLILVALFVDEWRKSKKKS